MTNVYRWVQWNRHKKTYDLVLGGAVVSYLGVFVATSMWTHRPPAELSVPVILIRALSTLAISLLTITLCIGPLARLTTLAAPLLYNRRHLGVTFFLVALAHAVLALAYYGGFGVRNPLAAVIDPHASFSTISGFPFELLGLLALLVFFVMAATSHDFWLALLSPFIWKTLHMLVYAAYGLVLLHVTLGALQSEQSLVYAVPLVLSATVVSALHIAAGWRERSRTRQAAADWVDVASVDDIALDHANVICLQGQERVAVFRHADGFSAVSNVCAHQGGPLGEGRIVGGCITCPWHGYQYRAADGCSPPPYTETVPTYELRIEAGRVLLNPKPNPPGTRVEPAPPVQGFERSSP